MLTNNTWSNFNSHRQLMLGAACVALSLAAGCGDSSAPATSSQNEAKTPESARSAPPAQTYDDPGPQIDPTPTATEQSGEPTMASFLGVRAPKPTTWIEHPPQSPMHHTTFNVPGADGGKVAQIVVFFFGRGQGGPIDMNIDRWKAQFRSPDGYEVRPEVRTLEVDGMEVTLVELEGEYMAQGTRWYTPDQRFITAVIDTPGDQRIFVRFVGDHSTVTENREAFLRMIEEMEWVGQ